MWLPEARGRGEFSFRSGIQRGRNHNRLSPNGVDLLFDKWDDSAPIEPTVPWEDLSPSLFWTNCQLLCFGVIEQALNDAQITGMSPLAVKVREQAWTWLMDRENEKRLSCNWYCSYLGLDPDYVRRCCAQIKKSPTYERRGVNRSNMALLEKMVYIRDCGLDKFLALPL